MGRVAGNVFPGGDATRKYLISATFSRSGIIAAGTDGATLGGLLPTTTTAAPDAIGVTLDTATYSATPAAGATGFVTVAWRPFNILEYRMSGGAAEGTALTIMTESTGDVSTPDLISSTNAQANSMIGGTVWRYKGDGQVCPQQESRIINAHTASVSVGVAVDFENAINIGDQFLMCPWAFYPGDGTDTSDGMYDVQFTTNFQEADASIATATGYTPIAVHDLILMGANDSRLQFILGEHPYFFSTVSS